MANKRYIGDVNQTTTFTVKRSKPLDDRSVVRTQANLFDAVTWTVDGDLYVYSGMLVGVVADSNPNNNGLYMLLNSTKYTKQNWNPQDVSTYDAMGWMHIGGEKTLLDLSRLNEDVSPGSFTTNPDGEYYSDFINGGTF